MARTILAIVERILITAVSFLLAAIVIVLFARALRGPGSPVAAAPSASATTIVVATTSGPIPRSPGATPVAPTTTVTSTTFGPVFLNGPCSEEEPASREGVMVLRIYFTCGNNASPTADMFVYRSLLRSQQVLTATLNELVKGPSSSDKLLGFRSIFTNEDAEIVDSLTVSSGEAVIDFSNLPPVTGLGATDDADFFVANLNANVFQFTSVKSVEYRLGGSCAAFWGHLGHTGGCRIIAQENFLTDMAINRNA